MITIVAMMIGMTSTAQVKTRNENDLYKQDGIAYEYRQVIYLQYVHSVEQYSEFKKGPTPVTGKEIETVYNYMVKFTGEDVDSVDSIQERIENGEVVYLVYKINGFMISLLADEYDIILTIK